MSTSVFLTKLAVPKHLLDFFPTIGAGARLPEKGQNRDQPNPSFKEETLIATIKQVQESLRLQKAIPEVEGQGNEQDIETTATRPGANSKHIRVGQLPPAAFPLYEAAAGVIAGSVNALVAGVAQTEWKLQLCAEAERRREAATQSEEDEETE